MSLMGSPGTSPGSPPGHRVVTEDRQELREAPAREEELRQEELRQMLEKRVSALLRNEADEEAMHFASFREGFYDGTCLWMREDLVASDPFLRARTHNARALPLYIPVGAATGPTSPGPQNGLGAEGTPVIGTAVGPPALCRPHPRAE